MRDCLVGVLALVLLTCLTAEAQQGSTVIEDGTSQDGSSAPVKYAVNVIERVIPGGAVINDFTQYGAATAGMRAPRRSHGVTSRGAPVPER